MDAILRVWAMIKRFVRKWRCAAATIARARSIELNELGCAAVVLAGGCRRVSGVGGPRAAGGRSVGEFEIKSIMSRSIAGLVLFLDSSTSASSSSTSSVDSANATSIPSARFVIARRTCSRGFCFLLTRVEFALRSRSCAAEIADHAATLYDFELQWVRGVLERVAADRRPADAGKNTGAEAQRAHAALVERALGVEQRRHWNKHKAAQNWRAFSSSSVLAGVIQREHEARCLHDAPQAADSVAAASKDQANACVVEDGSSKATSSESLSSAIDTNVCAPSSIPAAGCMRRGDYGPVKGFVESSDSSPAAAAARECEEELWLRENEDFQVLPASHLHQSFGPAGTRVGGGDFYLARILCDLDKLLQVNRHYRPVEHLSLDELVAMTESEQADAQKAPETIVLPSEAPPVPIETSAAGDKSSGGEAAMLAEPVASTAAAAVKLDSAVPKRVKIEVFIELIEPRQFSAFLPREFPERMQLYEWAAEQVVSLSRAATSSAVADPSSISSAVAVLTSDADAAVVQSAPATRRSRSRSPNRGNVDDVEPVRDRSSGP